MRAMREMVLALFLCCMCVSIGWADMDEALLPPIFTSLTTLTNISKDIAADEAAPEPLSADKEPFRERRDDVVVYLSVTCENDAAMEKTFRKIAEAKLKTLKGVAVGNSAESATILLSFVVLVPGEENPSLPARVVYSFAYGMPELSFIEDELIFLPRFIYHEPVVSTSYLLERSIGENIEMADETFIGILRQGE